LPLETRIDSSSEEFRANAERMRALNDELAKRRAEAALGGPERARDRAGPSVRANATSHAGSFCRVTA
jgi:hypothetical protein